MPRRKQTKRSDNRYEYKCTIGKDIHGKPIRKSFYSTVSVDDAKRQAEEYRINLEVSARTGEAFIQSEYNFGQWVVKWLETYKKPFVDRNTYISSYKNVVEIYLIPFFGAAKLSDIRPADIQTFFGQHHDLSESYLKKMKMCLNGIFESAIENNLCFKNPAKRAIIRSTAVKREKKVFTDEEIDRVKQAAKESFPPVFVLLETGLRRGELCGLMWSDIDLDNLTLSVNRAAYVENGKVDTHEPKWKSYRTIPISQELSDLLRSLPHESLYVFPNRRKRVWDPNSFSRKLSEFMSSLDVPQLSAHELRHTYGTMLRRHGVDIYTIQKILGHRDIKMTSEIYVHNEVDQLRKSVFPPNHSPSAEAESN